MLNRRSRRNTASQCHGVNTLALSGALLMLCMSAHVSHAGICPPLTMLTPPAPGSDGTLLRIGLGIIDGGRRAFLEDEVDVKWLHLPIMQLSIGMSDDIELIFEHPMMMIMQDDEGEEEEGTGDLSIFGLYKLINETPKHPSLTLEIGVKLPNADYQKELGTDETDFFLGAIIADRIGSSVVILNTTFGIIGNPYTLEPTQDDVLIYELGIYQQVTRSLSIAYQVEGIVNSRFENDQSIVQVGFAYRARQAVFDFSVGTGLNNESPDLVATVGVTIDITVGETRPSYIEVDPSLPAVELPAHPEETEQRYE